METNNKKKVTNQIKRNEILEAIKKSGYLMESEITSKLTNSGFFTVMNEVYQDPITLRD